MPTALNGNSPGVDGSEPDEAFDALMELGSTGLKAFSGRVHEEFLLQLQGTRAVKVFTEMRDNDPIVGAMLFVTDRLISQVNWTTEPAKGKEEDPRALKEAEFVDTCMKDMSTTWSNTVSELLSMLPFGWSYHELVYKKRDKEGSRYPDGRIGWKRWPIRAQETLSEWVLDENGGIEGMIQQAPPTYQTVYIPIEKALLFRTSVHKNNPEGRSVLRNAYRPWYFKKTIEEIEAIGIERDLAGLPVMTVPVDIMKSDAPQWMKTIYAEAKDIVVNIRRDAQEGIILPYMADPDTGNQTMKLELLSSGGSRSFDTTGIIERYDKRIAMTVLADFILLGHEIVGSFALSSDKTNLFAVTLGALLRQIRDVVNDHAIPRLMKLNGVPQEYWPTLNFSDIESPSLAELGQFVTALVGAGVPLFPDKGVSEYLLRAAGLPIPEHDLNAPATPPGGMPGMVPGGMPGAMAPTDPLAALLGDEEDEGGTDMEEETPAPQNAT